MTITEFLEARIAEDEAVARAATPGPWKWWNLEGVDQGWADNGPNLETVSDEWEPCKYFCTWEEPDDNHRGEKGEPGHEHRKVEQVIGSWGHDANGINIEKADAEFIAANNPIRVLAECAAKRAIIDAHKKQEDDDDPSAWIVASNVLLKSLAAVYTDHPDYQQEWANE